MSDDDAGDTDELDESAPDDVMDGTDAADLEDDPHRRFESWRERSGLGAVGTGIARGLQAVFQPSENKPVVSAPIPGEPPDADDRIRVTLDPDDPTKSVAVIPNAETKASAPTPEDESPPST